MAGDEDTGANVEHTVRLRCVVEVEAESSRVAERSQATGSGMQDAAIPRASPFPALALHTRTHDNGRRGARYVPLWAPLAWRLLRDACPTRLWVRRVVERAVSQHGHPFRHSTKDGLGRARPGHPRLAPGTRTRPARYTAVLLPVVLELLRNRRARSQSRTRWNSSSSSSSSIAIAILTRMRVHNEDNAVIALRIFSELARTRSSR